MNLTTLDGYGYIAEATNNHQDRAMLGSTQVLTGSSSVQLYILVLEPHSMNGYKIEFTASNAKESDVEVIGADYMTVVRRELVSLV